jgi:hypothetical protein
VLAFKLITPADYETSTQILNVELSVRHEENITVQKGYIETEVTASALVLSFVLCGYGFMFSAVIKEV